MPEVSRSAATKYGKPGGGPFHHHVDERRGNGDIKKARRVNIDTSDLHNRDDIDLLVNDFYGRVRGDDLLAPVFDDIAGVNWETHIPKIGDFWETALFRSGNYRGNPLRPHLQLSRQTSMDREKFQRWLDLFFATVDSHFFGENAEHIKRIAADMAEVMQKRIAEF